MIPIRVIIADDHEILREGFMAMFENSKEIEVISDCANGKILVSEVEKLRPDVVVTDIQMPEMDGIEATRIIHKRFPEIPVIALSSFDDDYSVMDMLKAGAIGYLVKNSRKDTIVEAIRSANKGDNYYSRTVSQKISALIASGTFDPKKLETHDFEPIELRIIRMICEGKESVDMVKELKISMSSVNRYRIEINEKTGAKNVAALVVFAMRTGIYPAG